MPASRPRASFESISPHFDLKALVESTPNFSYVDRISCDMIDQQGLPAFEKLVLLHVIIGGKPLVVDGLEDRLDPWTFSPKWLKDNCGSKHEQAWNLKARENIALTMAHYLNNMGMLTNQFFEDPEAYKETKRQRVYLKDIDCPPVWQDKLREQIPAALYYLNESTGEVGGPGAVLESSNAAGNRMGRGIARAGDLMSSLPQEMRAENLMCYIGHEGTYTPAHREMCASLGHNIMVEASNNISDDGKPEKPGSSIWFMTESKDRHTVSEYWLSVLGHDIEVEKHFAQVVAWKKAPFNVYVVEQRPGDFILIPPLAPHQVWNRGTRTMKVAWNRTTVETLEMALNEALPRSRIVCRDEQYKNKAIVYYTLQKYSGLLTFARTQASGLPPDAAQQLLYSGKIKQLAKDFRRLFNMYRQILLSEMFGPEEKDAPQSFEYIPFDSNVTCAYCRSNIFNRFLTCPSCIDVLGHNTGDAEGDPYDVCMDCYVMGRSCRCLSGHKWVEQFKWKELNAKYESWRTLIIALDGGQTTDKTPLSILEERKRYGKKTLAEVCKDQLKRRPWKDVRKPAHEPKSDAEGSHEEIVVDDRGYVKNVKKKRSKAWLKQNSNCHICCNFQPNWKMSQCTTCERWWCYGTLFRGWDKMPIDIMSATDWSCPHCLGICFAGVCRREGKMKPYEPKGTLLGHDTKQVADVRSVEALVDFSVSNLNWLKDDDPTNRAESRRIKKAGAEAQKAKEIDPSLSDEENYVDESRIELEYSPSAIDPALGSNDTSAPNGTQHNDDAQFAEELQQAIATLPVPGAMIAGAPAYPNDISEGDEPTNNSGYVPPAATMYPQPDEGVSYSYPGYAQLSSVEPASHKAEIPDMQDLRPFKRPRREDVGDAESDDIHMTKSSKGKKPRLSAAGFKSTDLGSELMPGSMPKAKNEAQKQFERETEKKARDKARLEGRFIMLQAARKGKKRIVKLKLPPSKLAQLHAQQAAKAALLVNEEAAATQNDAEAPAQGEDESEEDEVLLKSDIVPIKKQNSKTSYEKRQQNGRVINSSTKKALIPVEKDENYGYRASKIKDRSTNMKVGGDRRKPKTRNSNHFEYEEINIGSEDSEDGGLVISSSKGTGKEKRTLPSYLQSRHDDDDDYPDELPNDYKEQSHRVRPAKPERAPQTKSLTHSVIHQPTAGKRPTVRPVNVTSATRIVDVDDDDETQELADAAVDKVSTPLSHLAFSEVLSSARASPITGSWLQKEGEEQNRLAKLQALKMYSKPSVD